MLAYSELTDKFVYLLSKRWQVGEDKVIQYIQQADLNELSYHAKDIFNLPNLKEAFHYAELIKDDIMNKSNKPNDNPHIMVSYVGCGPVGPRWQWGNDNGGPACTGANRCWGTILNGNYVPNMEDTLYSPIINASGYANIVLKFKQWYYTENNFDQGFVLCSSDGGATWQVVAGPYQGNSGGWINTTLTLPCANTSQLRIAFRFKSDGSVQYYGWYIDDVIVEGQSILGTTILYASSFEGADNGDLNIVTIGGTAPWQRGVPTSGPLSAYHGSNVWATNLIGNYNNNADQAIEKQTAISLNCPGCNAYYMRFYHWYQTETNYDSGWVELNTGAGWFKFSPTYKGSNTTWSLVQLDLTTYSGSSIRFRFRFKSDGSINYAGWYIDSVSIIGLNLSPSIQLASYDFNANDGGWTATQNLSISDPYMISNNYLEWYFDILPSNDLGTYTARTGPAHPFGTISILYGAQFNPVSVWTSWTTIHVASSLRDYISKNGAATPLPGWTQLNLKNYASTIICENSPPRVTFIYNIINAPDNLTVKEIFWIEGTDANSSRLWHKTIVKNNSATPTNVGIRWQYDTHVGSTDHPAHFRCDYYPSLTLSCSAQITNEETVNPVPNTFDFLRESDTDPPTRYHLFLVYGDGGASLPITIPDFVQHIRWVDAHNYTWDQGVNGENISLSTGFDNAFNYFFNPVLINPGDSIVRSHFIGSPITPTPVNYDEIRIGNYRVKVYKTVDGFNIYYDGKYEIEVSIYNLNGSLIKRLNLRNGNNYVKIPRSGVYIIKGENWLIKAVR
jgi:hypothetical protein